jgi:TrmH family RNA methyltransferase
MRREITSSENPAIRRLRSLRDAGNRRELGLFLVEGPLVIAEALQGGNVPQTIVCALDRAREHEALLSESEIRGCELILVPASLLATLSDTRTPQGVVAAFRWMPRPFAAGDIPGLGIFVLLDRLQDPGNMGTILRTADAVGAAGGGVSPGCGDGTNPKVVRSAMGSLFRVPVYTGELVEAIGFLRKSGWRTLCGHMDGEDFFGRGDDGGRTAIVIGNEAAGASEPVASACDERVRLPMPGGAPSLNAAVAAGVMLYDLMRRHAGTSS